MITPNSKWIRAIFRRVEPFAEGGNTMLRMISVAAVAVLVLSSCQSGPFRKKNKTDPLLDDGGLQQGALEFQGLAPALETRFPDVPLPVGVKEDLERSFVYESRSLQIGRMVYRSKHSVNEVSQFYVRESPKYSWTLLSVLQAEGVNLLFEKPGKRMWVNVRKSGLTRGGSLIIINLTPTETSGQGLTSVSPL